MSSEALARLFGIVSGFLCLYSLSVLSISQGGTALSVIPGLEPRAPVQSAYFAIIIVGLGMSVACLIAIVHVRRPVGAHGWRFPIVGLGDTRLDRPSSRSARLYVAFLIVALLLLPAFSIFQLNDNMQKDGVVWNADLPLAAAMPVACAVPAFWAFRECKYAPVSFDQLVKAEAVVDGRDKGDGATLWLANKYCDIAWARGIAGPQIFERLGKGEPTLSAAEAATIETLRNLDLPDDVHTKLVASAERRAAGKDENGAMQFDFCASANDRSVLCAEELRSCRGVEWLSVLSPWGMIVASVAAWGMLLWLLLYELALPWARTFRKGIDAHE